jgi:hypothetical protein
MTVWLLEQANVYACIALDALDLFFQANVEVNFMVAVF